MHCYRAQKQRQGHLSGKSRARRHIVVEDNGSGDSVDNLLIASRHFMKSAIYHSLVCKTGGKALVVALHGHLRHLFSKKFQERIDVAAAFRVGTVHLPWKADNDFLHRFLRAIILEKFHKITRAHCSEWICANLERIRHCNSAAFSAIVDGKKSAHIENEIK